MTADDAPLLKLPAELPGLILAGTLRLALIPVPFPLKDAEGTVLLVTSLKIGLDTFTMPLSVLSPLPRGSLAADAFVTATAPEA